MRPTKTDQARDALRTRGAGLGALERHVLIVSNGERTRQEILAMLGGGAQGAQGALERLLRDGFLRDADAPAAMAATPASIATPLPAPAPRAAAHGTASSRRSVAAAKLYMLDMLQLQRGRDAGAIADHLRASRQTADIAHHIAAALDHVREVAAASYSERVTARLLEVAPAELLAMIGMREPGQGDMRAA